MEAKYIKFKNIFIVCILLIFLVSLSTAVASDLDDINKITNEGNLTVQSSTAEPVVDESNQEITNDGQVSESDQLLASSNDEDVLGVGDITALRNAINSGSNVNLNDDYQINNVVTISSNKVIDGQNHYIRATSSYRIFTINSNAEVTLKNIKFMNGKQQGGAIYITNGKVNIINCTFESNNPSSYNNGGAIYVSSGSLNLTDSTFKSNGYYSSGGAIYLNSNANVDISKCTFDSNKADTGGAIYSLTNNLKISDCTFKSNTASSYDYGGGGAIYSNSVLEIRNSTFELNTASSHGGAIYSISKLNIINSTFKSNTVSSSKNGGAIYSKSTELNITDSTFKSNTGFYGGALYSASNSVNIVGSDFESNYASSRAGALYFDQVADGQININESTFTNNNAPQYGGAICFYSSSSDSQTTYDVNLYGCNFTDNVVATTNFAGGGAIFVYRDINVYVYSSIFTNNTALQSDGGAIRYSGNLAVYDSKFYSNKAYHGGALCYGNIVSLTVRDSIFEDNYAGDDGGAIKSRSFDINNATFINNTAAKTGGALVARSSASNLALSKFYNNSAPSGGAVFIHNEVTDLSISSATFVNNDATYGGAIYSDTNARIGTSGSTFTNNTANEGGAAYFAKGKMVFSTSDFYDNNASVEGGAIHVSSDGGEVSLSNFYNNYAPLGGAIYWQGNNGKVLGSVFRNNVAINGTSIYWAGNNGNVDSSYFEESNVATGAIYWHGNDGIISGSTFNGLKGVYLCSHSSATLSSNTQYSSSQTGYAIYNDGNASFSSNNFQNLIYNYGIILSQTYLVTLKNMTIVTDQNSRIIFTAVEDDNGNYIYVTDDIKIVYDGDKNLTTTFNNTHYITYLSNMPIGLHTFVGMGYNASTLTNLRLKNGAILYLVMNLTVNQTNYGEKVVFTTQIVNTTLNGTVILKVNDVSYTVPLINGTAVQVLYDMAPNTYVVVSSYLEYNQTLTTDITIDVQLRNSTLNVTANNITYGDIVTINVNVTNGTTGSVYIFVNNKMYIVKLVNSTGQLNLTNLPGGVYTIYAVYNGDVNFMGSVADTIFTVDKHNVTINITAPDIERGQTAIIKVQLPSDANGTTYVYIDSTPYLFTKQPIRVAVANLTSGNHTVSVIYEGNDKYLSGSNSTTFEVHKIIVRPTIVANDIKVGDNATITVNLNGATDATGRVFLNINGRGYYTYANKTKATFVIPGLAYGTYNVTATYEGDDKYYSNSTNGSFKVDYVVIDPKITYSVDDNLDVIVNVTVPSDANGDIIIEVNGINYTSDIIKGLFTVPINDLEGGVYPAMMYFANDTKYHAVNKPFNITLKKIDPTIYINTTFIYVGDNATITVLVPGDAKGNVTIRVYNDNYTTSNYTVDVTKGTSVFTVPGLAFGTYTVHAVYSGDRKYNTVAHDTRFNVRKVDPNPYSYINVTDIFVGETATFNITMPGDITAKINLTVQNKTYTVNVTNGFGQINITGLKYGYPVPVHAEFAGNEKYLSCSRDYTAFSVHRISNYPMNITAVTDDTSANITVNIPSDANGTGYFTISNETFSKTYTIAYTNGKSNMTTVTGLLAGKRYEVYAYFNGNDKYAPGDTVRTLNSNKTLNYTFNVTATDIFVGQISYVTIYLPNVTNGTVTIRLPDRTIYLPVNETFVNGTCVYPLQNLAAGSHLGSVTYSGNDIYEASSKYGTILVSKINVSPDIYYNTTYVGQNLTIRVTLPYDANGTVNITINNNVYNASVTNGTAYVTVPNLEAKRYDAVLFYSGNEKYNKRTQNFDVRVLRISNYTFELGVEDIEVGDNETITIHLPSDIDVNVTISIPGTVHINKTVEIIKGNGTIIISNFAVGVYNVTASVVNSSKYVDQTVTKSFTVSTIEDYLFNLHNLTTIYVRDNITFILDLPKDATGNVTVFIFDNNYTGEVKNGTAIINVTAKKEGTYAFTISFEQKGKYNYKSQDGFVVVIKKEVELNPIYNANVHVDENITFEFKLPSDATGNITITSRGVSCTGKLVNGSVNITIKGYPIESLYSPFISYTGDDKYFSNTTIATVNVTKVTDYDLNVTVANITVDQNETVNITLPKDVTEDVLISGNFSDSTYSVKVVNGTAQFVIQNLAAGNYSINVRYQGYQKYADKNVTLTFNVRKVVPPIEVQFINNDTIVVILPTKANGNATVVIRNNESVIKITERIEIINGRGVLNVNTLRPGNYSVNVTYLEGVRYLQNSTTRNITIPKIRDYILPISVEDIIVYENATVIIIVPENATGFVNIAIDGGEVIPVQITGNVVIYNATGLKVGEHSVQANYSNVEYEFVTNSTKFNVVKIKTVITPAISANVTNMTINLTLTESVYGGNLTVSIDGKVYKTFTNITTNVFNLTAPILPGDHVINIGYSGDENHTDASSMSLITIDKIKDYTLIVNATAVITVIDNATVIATLPKGIEGFVTFTFNDDFDETATINSTTGKAILVVSGLASGNYTVVASFSSDIYEYKQNTTNFTVIKLNTTIDVQVNNITKDMSEVINITLNNTATGYVYIDINGYVFRADVDENGTATLSRSNIPQGNYTAVITYMGDDRFNANSTTVYFTVSRMPVDITITAHDVFIGQEVNFTIETSKPITDQVTVRIDNRNYTAVLYNGKGNLIVLGQNVGLHNVTVFYAGDKDYLPANDTINVTVYGKLPTSVTVNVTNITVGESVTIYINLTGDVNGTVAIAMLGNPIIVQMVNGTGNYTYYNLTARDYHFTVAYFESEFYLASNATGDFTVFKKNSPISANVTNATVGDVEVITVNLPTNATGTVLLTVNGSNYYGKVDKGVARFNVTGLPVGNHTAYITYEGDNNYLENETEINLTTARRTTTINITTANVIVDGHPVTFTIMTSANLTEVVTVKIVNRGTGLTVLDNHTFIENGKGTFTAYGLRTGNYTAYVYFPGNTHYDAVSNSTNFTVAGKAPTSLNITVRNITVGETATIYVNVTGAKTGNVTIAMAGRPQTKEVVNGQVNFTYSGLAAGVYQMTVVYIENDDYLRSQATANLTVLKNNSTVSVNASSIFVGDVEYINITLSENATGHVLIDLGGMQVYAQINDTNILSVPIKDLAVGEYNVTVTYVGDNNYYESTGNASFNVTKRDLTINITTDKVIVVGHDVILNITTSANITEVVTITIGNNNYTTFVKEGKGTYTVHGLATGNYTATVYFAGNTYYGNATNFTEFNVTGKSPVSITVDVKNITLGEVARIHVKVNVTTGQVRLNMAGNPQTLDVNATGEVIFEVPNLLARDYHVTVTYIENDDYLSNSATANFTVFRKPTNITVNVSDIFVGDNETVRINVTAGATGVVLININDMKFYVELDKNSNATLILDNLGIGKYNVTATYMGDDNYLNSTVNAAFNVTKLTTGIVIEGSNITVGQTETFNITTSANITEVVYIEINGTNYTSFVKEGKGALTVPYTLEEGTYTVYVYFPGNSKYDFVMNHTVIKVSPKKASNITINVDSITVGDNVTIYVNVTDGATGTVAISVAGESYLVQLNNSKANITLGNLTARHYHVSTYYLGDDYYLECNNTNEFDVLKKQSVINVTATNGTVGEDTIIDINITNGTSGVVLIDINGTDYWATINNGIAQLIVKNLAVGNYTVTVTYNGDANYNASRNATKFKLSKLNSFIHVDESINMAPVAYGNDVLVKVTAPNDVTGVATLNVTSEGVSKYYTVYINNGEGSFIITKPDVGHYTVSAVYEENYKYLSNSSNTVAFEVYANGTELDVKTHNIYVGETENITVIIAGQYSGDVNITIDGTIMRNASLVYNATTNSSVAILHFSDKLDSGIHTVEAIYTADEGGKIVAHKGSAIFIVSKINSTVGIKDILDIKVGQNATIELTLLPEGATGTIDVYVNGEKHTVNVTNLTLSVLDLAAGHYEVQAMYSGDAKYESSSANASFTVFKNKITLELEVANITVDQSENINVTLRNATGDVAVDAFGYVLVNVNGTHYYAEIKDGVARITIKDLAIGKYDVNATFIGDDKYYTNSTAGKFNVAKLKTNITIDATDIFVGQDEVFKITTSENLTVVVTIKVNNNNYTAFIKDGKGNFTLSGLTAGPYNVTVYFNGNDKYDATSNVTNFTAKAKHASSINVTVADITVGDNITVYVNATAGINGPAYVTIAGVAYPCELINGKANFTVQGLSARDYVVSVFFMGNDEYELCNATSNFTVYHKDTGFTIAVTNSTVGSVEYINVTLNDPDAKGTVLLTIGGAQYFATIDNGVARFNVTGLKEGVYNVTVNYEGDEVYNPANGIAKVNITKLTTIISIEGINITVGQDEVFNITTSAILTEVVTIRIVGVNNYTAYVIDGKGNYTVSNLAVGNYTVYVNFPGNDQYGPAQGSANFTVTAKKASEVTVNVSDITVGENATVRVNVTKGATGNVTIVIAGEEYTETLDADGVAVFNIPGLSARDYHVTAIYRGDTFYEISKGTANFTVLKKDAPISIVVTNSTVGSVEYINVTVPIDATEYVLLTIGDSHYYADVIDGVARFNVTGLLVGNYTAKATYVGDANYTSNFTGADFTVSKIKTVISISGDSIYVGQEEVLTFEIDQNITSLVHIEIEGVNRTAYLVEGKGTLAISNLTVNTYVATVYYDGDDVYMPSNNITTFSVMAKTPSAVTINVTDITVGDVAKIIVNVTKGATGNVTLVIAGNETSLKVNDDGIVEFNMPNLTARDYHITAIYEGDTYYDGSRNTAEFTVHRIPTSVELNVSDIIVGDTEIINVTVVNATTGVVLININGTCYYSDLKDGMATFNIPGLKTGNYEAVVKYVENEKYANSSAAKSFKVQPLITLEVGENNGNTTPITVIVSDNATGKVNVTIGNKTYEADVVNGTATVNVVNATPGKQDVTVTFDDGTGNPTVQNKTVDIPKVTGHTVTANATVVDKGNGTVEVVVTGPADAEGNVTVTIGNQTVTVPMENGTAKVNVTGVPVGSHDVDVSYSGDDKYGAVSNRTHVNMPINLPTVNVVDHLVRGWNSQFDYEAVFTNEFGEVLVNTTVTFVVNGKPYTVKTETHGIARLSETLPVGEYTITSINPVTGENVTKKLSIVPRLIYNKDLTMDFVDGSHWDVLVIGDDGNPVGEGEIIDIYVNTIHYVAKTDKNGYARLKINLNPNKYHITAEYKNFKVQNNLVVKQTLKLVKKTVKVKKGKKLVLKAKLKWSNGKAIKGKKIVFKFKGKKYKAKTNSKGIAKVTVKKKVTKKLKKGKKYSYSATYITNTVKGKVKVKK